MLVRSALVAVFGVLALTGCDSKNEVGASVEKTVDSQRSAPIAPPDAPAPKKEGTITVVAGEKPQPQKTGDKFRTYDVRGQSQISFAPAGQEVTDEVRNVQVVVAARNNPYVSIQASLLAKRLSKQFIVLCSACHDDYGNGVIGPSLIGKSSDEVRKMIDKYSSDPNANVLMTELVRRMTPDEIDFIARDLARFNAEIQEELKKGGDRSWLKELNLK